MMSPEDAAAARYSDVVELIGQLRSEIRADIGTINGRMDSLGRQLDAAITSLRSEFVTTREFEQSIKRIEAAICDAVEASEKDSENLWRRSREMQSEVEEIKKIVYKGVGAAMVGSAIISVSLTIVKMFV